MTNQLQRVPRALQDELAGQSKEIINRAYGIFALLDRRARPVRAQEGMRELHVGPHEYRSACRLLLRSERFPVYVTPAGLVLRKHATKEHRFWHMAWSMGLFEMSSQQLTLDEDILDRTPEGVLKLLEAVSAKDMIQIQKLQKRAKDMRTYVLKVAEMYQRVGRALEAAQRPQIPTKRKEVRGTWSNETWKNIKKQLKGN